MDSEMIELKSKGIRDRLASMSGHTSRTLAQPRLVTSTATRTTRRPVRLRALAPLRRALACLRVSCLTHRSDLSDSCLVPILLSVILHSFSTYSQPIILYYFTCFS